VQVVGVVGGGLMGAGIAFTIASKMSCRVILREVSLEAVSGAKQRVDGFGQRAMRKGTPPAEVDAWLGRVQYTTDLAELAPADLAVEAVFEDLDLKRQVFAGLDGLLPPPRVLCSNTSGISISMIAGATQHPERVIGTHFFNPAPVMKLVEVVTGLATDKATIDLARSFCHTLGKETILVKDFPGFVVTRVGQAMMCEAVRCLEQGVASAEDIDRGMRLGYNYPLGPLELIDLIGADTELQVMQSLFAELGETFRPSPLMKAMVAAGQLGRKSGRGFYAYPQGGR
jgi:3-hydroxybutyryl-CoA dehydrogenase